MTLLSLLFLACALAGGLRAAGALRNWSLLKEFDFSASPVYFLLSGLFCLGLGSAAALSARAGWHHANRFALAAAVLLVATFWADRLIADRSGFNPPNGAFAAIISAAGVLYTAAAVFLGAGRRYLLWKDQVRYDSKRSGN